MGLATARALALRGLRVVVLERERTLGEHQTTHNSGVIHAGHLLRARVAEGAAVRGGRGRAVRVLRRPRDRRAALRQARRRRRPDDLPRLDELERRARANGVQGLPRLGPDEIPAIEPAARGLSALHSPNTGWSTSAAVAGALRRDVEANGGELRRGAGVRGAGRARGPRRGRPGRRLAGARAPCGRLRGRVVGPAGAGVGSAARRADRAVPGCVPAAHAAASSCAARSTRCPTRRCRSSACTCRARSRAR